MGLVHGIEGAWHFVTDKLKSLIGGLSSVAKKLLGIKSPSLVFAEIGKSIAEGLQLGMDASSAAVAASAAKMIAASRMGAGGGMRPAMAGGHSGAGGGSVVNQHFHITVPVHVPSGMLIGNAAEVGEAIAPHIERVFARRLQVQELRGV